VADETGLSVAEVQALRFAPRGDQAGAAQPIRH
jgi:hypothetical protein